MALPSSGQISMNDIRIELGVPTQSPFNLNTARAGGYVTLNPCSPTLPPSSGQVALSDWYGYNQTASCGGTATLSWTFNINFAAPSGEMILYVNGNVIEDRSSNASGTWTVNVGDTINVEIITNGCTSPNSVANAYCTGIINEAACASYSTSLFTSVYTVTSGDAGTTLYLNNFAACDVGCL